VHPGGECRQYYGLLDGILPVPRSGYDRSAAHDGLQAAGAAPLITGQPVANPDTVATAIALVILLTGNGRSQFNQQVLENLTPSPMLKFWTPIDFWHQKKAFSVNLPVPHRWRGC